MSENEVELRSELQELENIEENDGAGGPETAGEDAGVTEPEAEASGREEEAGGG